MMNKNKTAQIHLSRFLFLLPVISVSLLSFRSVELRHTLKEPSQPIDIINMLADIEPVKNVNKVAIQAQPLLKTIVTDTPRQTKKVVLDRAAITNSSIFNNDQQQPLILINGTETNVKTLSAIHPTMIEHVQVLKNATAIEGYGEKGKNGVILITTKGENYYGDLINYTLKSDESTKAISDTINYSNAIEKRATPVLKNVNYYYYPRPTIEPVAVDVPNMPGMKGIIRKSVLKSSDLNRSVHIDDEKNDLYIVETNNKWEVVQSSNESVKRITEDVVFIFDKKEISIDKAQSLPPETIKSIRILKNAETIEKYGYKGKKAIFEFSTQSL